MVAGGCKQLSVAGGIFLVALGVWATPTPTLTTFEWSRLAAVDTKVLDGGACAVSSAVWTLGAAGDSWEGKARSSQLLTAPHSLHPPQLQTDLCTVH